MPVDGEGADLAGYANSDELAKAYRSSGEEAKRQKARADALEQRSADLEARFNQFQQRQVAPQRGAPADRLAEYGVPVDALQEYVTGIFAQAFEPIAKGAVARTSMLSKYPDYQKFEADVAQFVNEDPHLSQTYQKLFQVDPEGAMEFAMLKFTASKKADGKQPGPQGQARSEAQIPSNRTGDARTQPAGQDEDVQKGWDYFQKTNDPRAFAKARLHQVISDDFLNK